MPFIQILTPSPLTYYSDQSLPQWYMFNGYIFHMSLLLSQHFIFVYLSVYCIYCWHWIQGRHLYTSL